ncbi:deoxyribonuclease IV [Candidatus Bathyarchaeota archaeon]|nr:deoxyribonuclease IV [Candidatus Bathyarchaeota archaeon]
MPINWSCSPLKDSEVEAFKEKVKRANITPIYGHMPYVSNLASPNNEVYRRSMQTLKTELYRCSELEIPFLVVHLGSHLGAGLNEGMRRIAKALDYAIRDADGSVKILIENSSGAGGQIGSTFQEMKQVLFESEIGDMIGVCLDTCHGFAAGYEFRSLEGLASTLKSFDDILSFELLQLVHLNDSLGEIGSKIDQHEHIGLGRIGDEGFKLILKSPLSRVPLIMETPYDKRRTDEDNMKKVLDLARPS